MVRFLVGDKKYQIVKIGISDDKEDADGISVFDYRQAQVRARELYLEHGRKVAGVVDDGPFTVESAIKNYIEDYKTRGGKSLYRMLCQINAHILPALANVEVKDLTRVQLKKWRDGIANSPARVRTKIGQVQKFKEPTKDPDNLRKRRAAANKVATMLKSALNYALQEREGLSNADAWRELKPFKNVESPKISYLNDGQSKRLVNVCGPEMRELVTGALLTGCRYGELTRLRVQDYGTDNGSLYIGVSKSGKGRYVALPDEGRTFFDQMTAGKAGGDLIFIRENGNQWGKAHQYRLMIEACKAAKIVPGVSFHILRHTYASRLAMKGVSMAVIAKQLGHADTRICEKHYAHLSPDYVAETVRAEFGSLGIVEETNIARLS
jgi:integrase